MDFYVDLKHDNFGNSSPISHQGLIPKTTELSFNIYATLHMSCKKFNFLLNLFLW
jgi:hypothetical protein